LTLLRVKMKCYYRSVYLTSKHYFRQSEKSRRKRQRTCACMNNHDFTMSLTVDPTTTSLWSWWCSITFCY